MPRTPPQDRPPQPLPLPTPADERRVLAAYRHAYAHGEATVIVRVTRAHDGAVRTHVTRPLLQMGEE